MIFVPSALEDIRRYYTDTYVKFPQEFGDKLFFISGASPRKVEGQDEDGQEFVLWLDENYPYVVEFALPRKSYFQHEDKALLLYRIPAKQYSRGITSSNTAVVKPVGNNKTINIGMSFAVLRSYVNKQKFFSLPEAIATGFEGCVLSSRMAYNRESRGIFIDTTMVAQVTPTKRSIKMLKPMFRPEIESLVKDSGGLFDIVKAK